MLRVGRTPAEDANVPHEYLNPDALLPGRGFSHVAVAAPGRIVHVAGQTAHGPEGSVHGTTVVEQLDRALQNLVVALDAASARPEDVVAMQLYVVDMPGWRDAQTEIGVVWRRRMGRHFPAISLLGVAALADAAALVEVVVTAVVPDGA